MAKITRISTTLTARYSPASGATDAFWLDGRITGPREARAADITLDREDRSFFYAVFATQTTGDSKRDIEEARSVLEKTHLEIKHSSKNIDNQITDLAECSIGVSGRISLQHEGVRQPFFAGIMVKDSEIAAVTMGRGCAYLYRNDTLYPLTKDDLPFEAIDCNGKNVPNIDIYCAGVAGTVRYSNIAQLQVDDCIIMCNREVMEAIGQREMLRLLLEAQDQSDAAGMIITEAASKLPGTPIQFMIGFVESITTGEKPVKTSVLPMMAGKSASASSAKSAGSPKNAESVPEDEDYAQDDNNDEYDEEEYEDPDSGKMKKIALIAVVLIVLIGCGYAIYTMIFGNHDGKPSNLTPTPTTVATSGSVTEGIPTPTTGTGTPAVTATPTVTKAASSASVSGLPTTHEIQPGELLPQIAQKYYKSSAKKYLDAIVAANKAKYPDFTTEYYQQGWKITIPVV